MAGAAKTYLVSLVRQAISGAITLIQIKAGATVPLEIIRMEGGQTSSTTSTQIAIQLNRKTAGNPATGLTLFTPIKLGGASDPAASAAPGATATGIIATGEGVDGDILWNGVWNYLTGFLWTPTHDKEKKFVEAAGMVGLKFPVAPGAPLTVTADVVFAEF